jgi:hypothetical protein
MSATISIPCFKSDFRYLSAYIRPVFTDDLRASIYPKGYIYDQKDLGATFGYVESTLVQDKLTINLNIAKLGIRTEDTFNINFSAFRGGLSLAASITPQRHPRDLGAYIAALPVYPYSFDNWKERERVYKTTYTQVLTDYEDIGISFQEIVNDYFYSSGSNVVAKVDRSTHFITKVASYYSEATSLLMDRKLHKVRYLKNLNRFNNIDEAMRYAIWYVTTQPEKDLGAIINAIRPRGTVDMTATIKAKTWASDKNNLISYINGKAIHDYNVIIGYTDDGVGYLEF